MVFSKSFPRYAGKSNYPVWEEVFLEPEEEKEAERKATKENINTMLKCLNNAERLLKKKEMKQEQSAIIRLAVALFEKRASHEVFYKEKLCKEKFDNRFKPANN